MDSNNIDDKYNFLVCGHIYGDHNQSVYPSSSFLANIKAMNNTGAKFFVSLGDMLRLSNKKHVNIFRDSTSDLDMPIFNSVGNHDVGNRKFYEERFGSTYYDFSYGTETYIFLDSELLIKEYQDNRDIANEQIKYFELLCKELLENSKITNVFIFSHKLIWAVNKPEYQIVYKHSNGPSYSDIKFFSNDIEPLIINLAKKKSVFWISGDIGAEWSLPIFFEKEKEANITYIAVGIGDTEKDVVLSITIDNSEVDITPISLTNSEVYSIDHYGVKYWDDYFPGTFFSIIQRVIRVIKSKYFWAGVIGSLFCFSLILLCFRIIKSRKS